MRRATTGVFAVVEIVPASTDAVDDLKFMSTSTVLYERHCPSLTLENHGILLNCSSGVACAVAPTMNTAAIKVYTSTLFKGGVFTY
jgi:hypothetical protein